MSGPEVLHGPGVADSASAFRCSTATRALGRSEGGAQVRQRVEPLEPVWRPVSEGGEGDLGHVLVPRLVAALAPSSAGARTVAVGVDNAGHKVVRFHRSRHHLYGVGWWGCGGGHGVSSAVSSLPPLNTRTLRPVGET